MPASKATVTLEVIERIKARAASMPEKEATQRELSARAAVALVKKEVALLQQRGYTLENIAEFLAGEGLSLPAPTLRTYLQQANKASAAKRAKAKPTPTATQAVKPAATQTETSAATPTATPAKDSRFVVTTDPKGI